MSSSITQYIRLSNDTWVKVPEGAEPAYVRKIEESKLRRKAKPKRRKARRRSAGKRSTFQSASQVLGCSMVALIDRVNGLESDGKPDQRVILPAKVVF